MKRNLVLAFLAILSLASLQGCRRDVVNGPLYGPFEELDGYLAARDGYESKKKDGIEALRKLLSGGSSDYAICLRIADEYTPYQYDSTIAYLRRCRDIARMEGDSEALLSCEIRLGRIYTTSGHFMEAYQVLFENIDTLGLSTDLKREYYSALLRFAQDIEGNSGISATESIPSKEYYRGRYLPFLEKDSYEWRVVKVDELTAAGQLESADSLSHVLLSSLDPSSHDYAKASFNHAMIREAYGDREGKLRWLIRSAEGDIVNSIKDYAALTSIAQEVMHDDVARAFRYLQFAQKDAMFYNAKLRPWQISQFFMDVESTYEEGRQKSQKMMMGVLGTVALLAIGLIFALYFLMKRTRKLTRTREEMEAMNAQLVQSNQKLQALNKDIIEANLVKEEYIALFLSILSDNIDKMKSYENSIRNKLKQGKSAELLKELSLSNNVENELENFYYTFDSTFLSIYPNFVSEMNSLLADDSQIVLRKGELLNTELRIFALIRLGIDDSTRIASLLHYSVSTIYNYKVKIKNAAKGDRETFEERVKKIGRLHEEM